MIHMKKFYLAETFEDAKQILKSCSYQPISMAGSYKILGERLGVDFGPTIQLFELLPVFLDGQRHAEIRKKMAICLANSRSKQEQAAQVAINSLPNLAATTTPINLMTDFIRPLWRAVSRESTGYEEANLILMDDIPRLFDSRLRVKDRLEINERLRIFIKNESDNIEEKLILLGQNVLGSGPFIGTLTLSLHDIFSQNIGKKLKDITYPTSFPRSSLEVTDRVNKNESSDSVEPNIVRCVIHSKKYSESEKQLAMFGLGEHVCLGRPLSNNIWTLLTQKLATMPQIVHSSELGLKHSPVEAEFNFLEIVDPFLRPDHLYVQFTQAS